MFHDWRLMRAVVHANLWWLNNGKNFQKASNPNEKHGHTWLNFYSIASCNKLNKMITVQLELCHIENNTAWWWTYCYDISHCSLLNYAMPKSQAHRHEYQVTERTCNGKQWVRSQDQKNSPHCLNILYIIHLQAIARTWLVSISIQRYRVDTILQLNIHSRISISAISLMGLSFHTEFSRNFPSCWSKSESDHSSRISKRFIQINISFKTWDLTS